MAKAGTITEAERLRRLRGKSVTGLAREAGVSHSYVSLVEGGRMRPSARYRREIARALGLPETVVFPEYQPEETEEALETEEEPT